MSQTIAHFTWVLPIILLFGAFTPAGCHAQDGSINFFGDLSYTNSDNKVKIKSTGEKIDSQSNTFEQRYNFALTKTIYPLLSFAGGASFQQTKTESKAEGVKSTLEERILRPYGQLALNNPLFPAGINFSRTQRDEITTGAPNIESTRDEWGSNLGWKPIGLPEIDLRFNQIHTYDHPKTIDEVQNSYAVDTNYSWETLLANYSYSRIDVDNRLVDFDTVNQTHFGRLQYSHSLFDERLSFSTSYRIRYNIFKFSPANEAASSEVALQRSQGLFSFDNTPEAAPPALSVNNALIDGNLTASTGIDIGLDGDENTLTNIGIDFGFAVNVDQIRVWVDRPLSTPVANYFSWAVYTSPDNTDNSTWNLVATVSPARFATFDNRFEIPFSRVKTRFIKVVTRPLLPTVPDASNFAHIFVTEIQAFNTVSGPEVDNKITELEHKYDFSASVKVSDQTNVGYNFNFFYSSLDPSDQEVIRQTNAIFGNHVFNRIFSTSAVLSRDDDTEDHEDTVIYNYGIFLRGAYLPTFNQTLAFSGRSEKQEDDSSDDIALTLRNNAILYRGWSAFFDSGFNWVRALASDQKQRVIFLRAGTNFEPNRRVTMNLNYVLREFIDPKQPSQYNLNLDLFLLPFDTLSLSANLQWVKTLGPLRNFQSYVANWSPFPDGDLQFVFAYSESYRSEDDARDRNLGPGLTWNIGRHFSLQLAYNFITSKNNAQEVESNRLFANLKVTF